MSDRTPVTTLAELDTLDEGEMVEGYRDGFAGEPEPGGNRSKSYWHGWRNGAADRSRAPDAAARALARAVINRAPSSPRGADTAGPVAAQQRDGAGLSQGGK